MAILSWSIGCSGSGSKSGGSQTVATIAVSPSSPSIAVGATQQFTATAQDSSGNTVAGVTFTWTSSATTVATISSTGLATAVKAGTAQITAAASGVTSPAATLTVTNPVVATITISPASPSIAVGATQQFTATAKDSSGNAISGVTFTWASSATGVATIDSNGLAKGVTAGTSQITASAGGVTSSADTLTVTSPVVATIVVSPSSPAIAVGATQQFTATAKDSGGNVISGVTFTWASSATTVATISSSGLATGVKAGTTQITASASGITSAGDTLTVNAASACTSGGSESLLNGSYAFLLKGFDSSSNPALVIGALTFDGAGTITAGTLDANLSSGVQSNIAVSAGCYSIGADQRGLLVITTPNGTQNYRFSVGGISGGVASTGHMIGFDAAGPFTTGLLRKQSGSPFSNASASGNYAFGGSSLQNSANCASPCKFSIMGVIGFDGKGGVTGGSEDLNTNGTIDGNSSNTTWPASPIPIDSGGTYSVAANGRATLTFSFASGAGTSNTVLYLVSPGEAFFMASDKQTTSSVSGGTALLQSGAPFSANPLSGTYVGYDSGLGNNGRTDLILAGPLTSGSNSFNAILKRNDSGTFSSFTFSGTYTVSSSGRMIVAPTTGLTHQLALYLVSSSRAFYMIGNGSVDTGFFELQSGGPFSTSSASGTLAIGYIDPEVPGAGAVSGVAVVTPASNSISVTLDGNASGTSFIDQMQSATYSIDNTGLGLEPLGCSVTATPITCTTAFYIVSPTKVVTMDLQHPNTVIVTADQ